MGRYATSDGWEDAPGIAPIRSLNLANEAGTSGVALDGGVCRSSHAMAVTTSAGVTAGEVQLQGSLDGVNWYDVPTASITTTAESATSSISVVHVCRFVRAQVSTAITGGDVTVWVGSGA